MGQQEVTTNTRGAQHRAFMANILRDLKALDRMIDAGLIEADTRRIGAEQEMVLVDKAWRPSPHGLDIVQYIRNTLGDKRLTPELARFNAEANLSPVVIEPGAFDALHAELAEVLEKVTHVAAEYDCRPILAGIVPTLELRDLGQPNITPNDRYYELDRLVREMRGREFGLFIKGCDELGLKFPSIMLEALNTSFQVHLQVNTEDFPTSYNTAQLIAAPVLAICANSPLLLGKRLWHETRLAIFRQTLDTRRFGGPHREMLGRVRFGDEWVRERPTEIFRTDVARFRLFFGGGSTEDPIEALDRGVIPSLKALALHNGTVYRWNRLCYGRTDGKPHLRIENRYIPAGPTIVDEVANAALWIGAMLGSPGVIGNPADKMPAHDAANNFLRAARQGLETHLVWLDGKSHPVTELLKHEIVPLARAGLRGAGLHESEIDRYLGVIEARIEARQTGAQWQIDSFNAMIKRVRRGRAVECLTATMATRAATCEPVHTWAPASPDECTLKPASYTRVGQFMSTNLFTVHQDELVDLVLRIMDWEQIRHVLVEDDDNRLVGIITWRQVLACFADPPHELAQAAASEIMQPRPITGSPDMTASEALAIFREHEVSALPIVEEDRLVGIITEHDFARIAGELLEERRRRDNDPSA